MLSDALPSGSTPRTLSASQNPSLHGLKPKTQSAPTDSRRRHSLPLHSLPPNLWGSNTSSASLVKSEEAARGEHILDEATVAHRISALRQLNGGANSRHQYAKSTGARNSTFSQPVIVRTYSGAARPRPKQRDLVTVNRVSGFAAMASGKMELKMPPVEAFTFKGIMEEIKHGVAEDLERIAEICARSKYSLSNQYEVHMPPHGHGEPVLQTIGAGAGPNAVAGGPTLQAIVSDEDPPKHVGRRGGRRARSVAYGTLETIMSSSRSSDEDKSNKKPAAVIAEGVRGRAARKANLAASKEAETKDAIEAVPTAQGLSKHARSKSASFVSMIIDNAQVCKQDPTTRLISSNSLVSEPARPQASTATDPKGGPVFEPNHHLSPAFQKFVPAKPTVGQNEPIASILKPEAEEKSTILGSLGSWLPWSNSAAPSGGIFHGRNRSASHAEGSLRELLKSTKVDIKGKNVDRSQ
ncbi:uncharacterized protein L3040_002879 [Drepanopeziza brunnea f. sp. 'multigermtubi']|uniref:Uncharacterized protein n=1 Tax=Marssonina brunnea f. sp. multigermtubi (strain MB_m1) TaxID=1072389 RepID=K1X529_MARBU|nr:uncharacterized protein MBM_02114 [Drepanopeziza brunnea f. sp. 'multigermtubi' MB_m1]EKD20162.1 hypothetical protein MBM_02114 [Drepanopeziza brunnea f. sp. 'multigermtubi' MB_m1]KAJ5051014.1 hypothetical protein L3040_002879 [Drepanopeziza brunnea f. sp. 'multigermtubi']